MHATTEYEWHKFIFQVCKTEQTDNKATDIKFSYDVRFK